MRLLPRAVTVPYDQTVIVDLTGGDDKILERMVARGRQNVRKALRESPATCATKPSRLPNRSTSITA